jgi:hypothetical protein
MNKTTCKAAIVSLILLMSLSIKAQVPNGGFELWSVEPTLSLLMPDGWSFIAIPGIVVPVTSSATSHSGTLAARGEVLNTGLPYPADRFAPLLISITPSSTEFGFAVTEKYTELTGFYQFESVGGDQFHAIATMFHDTTGIGTGCTSYPASVSAYTPFSVPIIYFSDQNPNFCTITITIIPSIGTNDTHAGSNYLVDDLDLHGTVSVQDGEEPSYPPDALILEQNYPNPFNPQTRISYELQQDGAVQLSIFDSSGRLIQTLVDGHESAGIKNVMWDGVNANGNPVANGIYFYRLQTPYGSVSRKMVLLK